MMIKYYVLSYCLGYTRIEILFYSCYCAQFALSLAVALDRWHLGNTRIKNLFILVIALNLHYLCGNLVGGRVLPSLQETF